MKLPSLIGVIHLPALAGAPFSHALHPAQALQEAGAWAVKEALLLSRAGFQAVILENFGDVPFFKTQVPPETIASMAVIAAAVREAVKIQVGINILRNDCRGALAVAAVTDCHLIRVNALSGVVASDQGLIEGDAAYLIREKTRLHVDVAIFADVNVKHARTLSSNDLDLAIEDARHRALADAVIVTGKSTGRSVDPMTLQKASKTAKSVGMPLYVGSGVSRDGLFELKKYVDGVIVGSALRKGGVAGAPMDPGEVRLFAKEYFKKTRVRNSHRESKKTPKRGKVRRG